MIRKLLLVMLLINFIYVSLGVIKYGSQHVDAYGIWLVKAKAWLVEGEVPLKMLRDKEFSYSHQQYPLLLPAMMVGWSRLTSSLKSFLWLYPLIYSLILFILYKLLRLGGQNKTRSLVATVVASFMGPLMAQGGRMHAGLADIWICLLVALGMLAVRKKSIVGLTVIVMLASQIKLEGIFLLVLFVGLKIPWKRKLGWMGLAILPTVGWLYQVKVWGLPSDLGLKWWGLAELLNRLGVIILSIVKEMVNWHNWYVIWPIFWIGVFWSKSKNGADNKENMKILGLMMMGYVGVYLFSSLEPGSYVASSVDRVMLQLLPLYWAVLPNQEGI